MLALWTSGCSTRTGPAESPPASPADTRQAAFPDSPPESAHCQGKVFGHNDIPHPQLGTVRVFLVVRPQAGNLNAGCVAAVAAGGQVLPTIDVETMPYALQFADPVTDSTGNAFITFNPGRYDGVLVLVPSPHGFEDIGWNDSVQHLGGRLAYYDADLQGIGADGRYTIRQDRNTCIPNCATGTIPSLTLHWNGLQYVP
ncbi:hypothetical protein [Nocardia sp. NPDC020380]|uniref:hypothetical protein n=1 Tax=Nocardia sp. NPDC020380 TaxID=3364309 RepID=UPI0037A41CE2